MALAAIADNLVNRDLANPMSVADLAGRDRQVTHSPVSATAPSSCCTPVLTAYASGEHPG